MRERDKVGTYLMKNACPMNIHEPFDASRLPSWAQACASWGLLASRLPLASRGVLANRLPLASRLPLQAGASLQARASLQAAFSLEAAFHRIPLQAHVVLNLDRMGNHRAIFGAGLPLDRL